MRNKWKSVLVILSLLFIMIAILIKSNRLVVFDHFVYQTLMQMQSEQLTFFFRQITHLGDGQTIIFITILILLFRHKLGLLCLFDVVGNVLFNNLLKLIFTRDRPNILRYIHISGYSFPSGHAMIVMSFYGLLMYYICSGNMQKHKKILLCVFLGIIIILVGLSRIYLGVHFASDVLGGYLVSIIYLILILHLFKKTKNNVHCKLL